MSRTEKVVHVWTCDRCGFKEQFQSVTDFMHWSKIQTLQYNKHNGHYDLCPTCHEAFSKFMAVSENFEE